MTPRELNTYAYAKRDALNAQQRRTARTIYDLSLLIRAAVWAREVPDFNEVFPETGTHAEAGGDDQLYAAVRALNALMGGREE